MRLVNMKTSTDVIAVTITLVHLINGFALETGDNHCYRCSPGFVDENKCRESGKTTSCRPCSHGKYSSNLDYSTECRDCTTVFGCDVTQTLLRNCTPEHDSFCGCQNHETMSLKGICRINDEDFYVTNSGIWCRKCRPGSHVVEDCMISGTNSSCVTCEVLPYPTFNLFWTASKECKYCTICDINDKRQTLTKCTPTSDTVCTCLPGYNEQINGPVIYCSGQDVESNRSTRQQPNIIHNDVNITNTTTMIVPDRNITNRKPESNTSTKFYVTNSGIWCRKCRPGSHVVEDCMINGTNSSCVTCEVLPYPTFNLFWTASKECKYCTICDINDKRQTLTKCTPTSDTVCTCLPGYNEQINGPVIYCSGQDVESNRSTRQQPNIIHNDVNITNTTTMIVPDRNITNRKPESNTSTNIKAIVIVSTCIILVAVIVLLLVYYVKRCGVYNVQREQYKTVAQNPPISAQTQCVTTV